MESAEFSSTSIEDWSPTMDQEINFTANNSAANNSSRGLSVWMAFNISLYALICGAGMIGNGLVIYVVLRYATMRNSVTNTYIVNLAVSDFCFLIGLPFLIVTAVRRGWVFGSFLCKVFYILHSLNWFTSVFTLTVMSVDRYLAVCYAVESRRYRTPFLSRVVCGIVWIASLLVMMPVYLYCRTEEVGGSVSCTIKWPEGNWISADNADSAFIWYAFFLAFAVPVPMISVFYFLVVARLRTVGPNKASKGKKKSQRKVTTMVLAVITVYVICWLPYWLFQLALLSVEQQTAPSDLVIQLFQLITFLSYANSAVNPILYAFLSNNFRKTFARAFGCTTAADVNRALLNNERHSGACTQMHAKPCDGVPIAQRVLPSPPTATTMATAGARDDSKPNCNALTDVDTADAEVEVLLDNSTLEQTQQQEQIL